MSSLASSDATPHPRALDRSFARTDAPRIPSQVTPAKRPRDPADEGDVILRVAQLPSADASRPPDPTRKTPFLHALREWSVRQAARRDPELRKRLPPETLRAADGSDPAIPRPRSRRFTNLAERRQQQSNRPGAIADANHAIISHEQINSNSHLVLPTSVFALSSSSLEPLPSRKENLDNNGTVDAGPLDLRPNGENGHDASEEMTAGPKDTKPAPEPAREPARRPLQNTQQTVRSIIQSIGRRRPSDEKSTPVPSLQHQKSDAVAGHPTTTTSDPSRPIQAPARKTSPSGALAASPSNAVAQSSASARPGAVSKLAQKSTSKQVESSEPAETERRGGDSPWPPYRVAADAVQATLKMTGGLIATFLLSASADLLSTLTQHEQIEHLVRILQLNREQHNFNYSLPDPTDEGATSLFSLVSCIPVDAIAAPAVSRLAFQPCASTLNYDIGRKTVPHLSYYFYLIETFVESVDDAREFVRFAKSKETRARAKRSGLENVLKLRINGIGRFEREGGWKGESKRLISYVGESDGFDHLPPQGSVSLRTFNHFVTQRREKDLSLHASLLQTLSLFKQKHPEIGTTTYVTFLSTASHLPRDISEYKMKLLECIFCAARFSMVGYGGANVACCGNIAFNDDTRRALAPLPLNTPLSALVDSDLVPASIAAILSRKNLPQATILQMLSGLRADKVERAQNDDSDESESDDDDASSEEEEDSDTSVDDEEDEDDASGVREKKRTASLLTRRFKSGRPAASSIPTLSTTRLAAAQQQFPALPRLSHLKAEVAAAVAPFQSEPFFTRLLEVTRKCMSAQSTIMTPTTARAGFVGILSGSGKRKVVYVTMASGSDAIRVKWQVNTDAGQGPVAIRWDPSRHLFIVSRQGRSLTLSVNGGKTSVWEWGRKKLVERTWVFSYAGARRTNSEAERMGEEAKEKLAPILARILGA